MSEKIIKEIVVFIGILVLITYIPFYFARVEGQEEFFIEFDIGRELETLELGVMVRDRDYVDWEIENVEGEITEYERRLDISHFADGIEIAKVRIFPTEEKVSRINWRRSKITGEIPKDLGYLENLISLDFSYNDLSGEIPVGDIDDEDNVGLENLSRLLRLDLSNNNLSGGIPKELSHLESLRHLFLDNNDLGGEGEEGEIPIDLGKISHLESFTIGENSFHHLPETIGDLTSLMILGLEKNDLTSLPERIGNLTQVITLDLSHNKLEKIPEGIGGTDEEITYTSYDNEEATDSNIPGMLSLEHLIVDHNELGEDSIPYSLGNLEKLKTLSLRYNEIDYIPESLKELKNLEVLYLDNNEIEGYYTMEDEEREDKKGIPDINELSKLRYLSLYNNQFQGGLPEEMGNMEALEVVRLQENDFTGGIPKDLWTLPNLRILNIEDNRFGEERENEIDDEEDMEIFGAPLNGGAAKALVQIFAGRNSFTSISEDFLGHLESLRLLYLDNNKLGEDDQAKALPDDFWRLNETLIEKLVLKNNEIDEFLENEEAEGSGAGFDYLYHLDLSGNKLSGELSREIYSMPVLRYLNLADNEIESINQEIGDLTYLENLYLQKNNLTFLPDEDDGGNSVWQGMDDLKYFYAYDNEIVNFPEELGDLESLKHLFLHHNEIGDSIPEELLNLSNLEKLYINNNQISGNIPDPESSGLENLWSNLIHFLADDNNITGGLPDSLIEGLTSIERFSIKDNSLTGEFPGYSAFGEMENLKYFDVGNTDDKGSPLGNNRLTGTIPGSINDLEELEYFDFSHNQISGFSEEDGGVLEEFRSPNLISLIGHNNNLTNFPTKIGGLTSLRHLILHQNDINTAFPEGFENLTALETISLDENNFQGDIDELLENSFPSLSYLALNGNSSLGGDLNLLNSLSDLSSNLIYFNIRDTSVQGELPSLSGMSNLYHFSVSDNSLSGELPEGLGDLSSIEFFKAANSNLSGDIPDEITDLNSGIRYLNLGGNQLSSFPENIGNLSGLEYLGLYKNSINDSISDSIGELSNLRYFIAYDADLTGEIPEELGDLTGLRRLELHDNNLFGKIPYNLVNITGLVPNELRLYNNQLSSIETNFIREAPWDGINLHSNNLSRGSILEALSEAAHNSGTYLDFCGNDSVIEVNYSPQGSTCSINVPSEINEAIGSWGEIYVQVSLNQGISYYTGDCDGDCDGEEGTEEEEVCDEKAMDSCMEEGGYDEDYCSNIYCTVEEEDVCYTSSWCEPEIRGGSISPPWNYPSWASNICVRITQEVESCEDIEEVPNEVFHVAQAMDCGLWTHNECMPICEEGICRGEEGNCPDLSDWYCRPSGEMGSGWDLSENEGDSVDDACLFQ